MRILAMSLRNIAATVATPLLVSSCSDATAPRPLEQRALSDYVFDPAAQGFPDSEYLRIGQVALGFGGIYFDRDSVLTMVLTNPAGEESARRELAIVFARWNQSTPIGRVVHARYSFMELSLWRHAIKRSAFNALDAVSIGTDEARNKIVIGVRDPSDAGTQSTLSTHLQVLGIPTDAVVLERRAPIAPLMDLRDRRRPFFAGMKIQREDGKSCTAGPLVNRTGVYDPSLYMIVSSHCTFASAGYDGAQFYQPDTIDRANNLVGAEALDVEPFLCEYTPKTCRRSDAALVQLSNTSAAARGKIARVSYSGSIKLFSLDPAYEIDGSSDSFIQGDRITKVGQATGSTTGTLTGTCDDYVMENASNVMLLCQQTVAAMTAGPGDSGAPFHRIPYLTSEPNSTRMLVKLAGILVGLDPANSTIVFSPISAVRQEFGPLYIDDL